MSKEARCRACGQRLPGGGCGHGFCVMLSALLLTYSIIFMPSTIYTGKWHCTKLNADTTAGGQAMVRAPTHASLMRHVYGASSVHKEYSRARLRAALSHCALHSAA